MLISPSHIQISLLYDTASDLVPTGIFKRFLRAAATVASTSEAGAFYRSPSMIHHWFHLWNDRQNRHVPIGCKRREIQNFTTVKMTTIYSQISLCCKFNFVPNISVPFDYDEKNERNFVFPRQGKQSPSKSSRNFTVLQTKMSRSFQRSGLDRRRKKRWNKHVSINSKW